MEKKGITFVALSPQSFGAGLKEEAFTLIFFSNIEHIEHKVRKFGE